MLVPAASGGAVFGVFLAVVLVAGYVVLWAIWHFGFRGRDEEGRRRDRDDGA
jgi:hypothetical protein